MGHSYGGLVVKEVRELRFLPWAIADFLRLFNHIVEQTRAIFFLGTPHRGSSFGPWGRLAAFALQPLGSNPLILANLDYDSVVLSDLHEHFVSSVRDDLQVVNFYEQRRLCLLQLWFLRWQIFVSRPKIMEKSILILISVFLRARLPITGSAKLVSPSITTG